MTFAYSSIYLLFTSALKARSNQKEERLIKSGPLV